MTTCHWCGGPEQVNSPEGTPNVCPASKYPQGGLDADNEERIPGDHCNHVWTHDKCDWCGIEWLGDGGWNCPVCGKHESLEGEA